MLAPTDSAFAELDLNASNLDGINQVALLELLKYHVVDGVVTRELVHEEAQNTGTTTRASTDSLANPLAAKGISVSPDGLLSGSVGGKANITGADLYSSNGITQAINSVLLPFDEAYLKDTDSTTSQSEGNQHVEVAALSAGIAAAFILLATAIAVHKRRQADRARSPPVSPDDDWWGVGQTRGAPVHPA